MASNLGALSVSVLPVSDIAARRATIWMLLRMRRTFSAPRWRTFEWITVSGWYSKRALKTVAPTYTDGRTFIGGC